MKLATASTIAHSLADQMAPFCEREPQVVGSVRRRCREVKDIELIAVPRWEERAVMGDLFGDTEPVNLLHEWATGKCRDEGFCAVQWIKPGVPDIVPWPVQPDGRYWRGLLCSGIKLDVFLRTSDGYGCIELIRTGSANFSKHVMIHANSSGFQFKDGHLWRGDRLIPTPDEQSVFEALGLVYVAPEQRIDRNAIRVKRIG